MKCPNCGTEFKEGMFCPECGRKYESQKKDNEKNKKEQPIKKENCKKGHHKIIFTAIVVGIIVFVFCLSQSGNSSDDSDIRYTKTSSSESNVSTEITEDEIELIGEEEQSIITTLDEYNSWLHSAWLDDVVYMENFAVYENYALYDEGNNSMECIISEYRDDVLYSNGFTLFFDDDYDISGYSVGDIISVKGTVRDIVDLGSKKAYINAIECSLVARYLSVDNYEEWLESATVGEEVTTDQACVYEIYLTENVLLCYLENSDYYFYVEVDDASEFHSGDIIGFTGNYGGMTQIENKEKYALFN